MRLTQVVDAQSAPTSALPPELDDEEDDDNDDDDYDDELFVSWSREEALHNLFGLDNFIRAASLPDAMLNWVPEGAEVIGVYINGPDNYLVFCEREIYWYDGAVRIHIDYKSIVSVRMPENDDDPYLELVLKPKIEVLMLPVLHRTEDFPDLQILYEFIWYTIQIPQQRINIRKIDSNARRS